MTEELKRRGRLATALIAGPAVTVGFLGAGMAPVLADEQADQPPAGDLAENQSEAETDPEAEGGAGGEDGQAASAPDTQDDSVNPSDLGGPGENLDEEDLDDEDDEPADEEEGDPAEEEADPAEDGTSVETFQESGNPSYNLNQGTYWWGQTIELTIENFPANTEAEVFIDEASIGTVAIDENGHATFTFDLDGLSAGRYTLNLEHPDLTFYGGISFEVREAPPENEQDYWWYEAPEDLVESSGLADWVQNYIDASIPPDSDAIGGRFEYSPDAQVYAEPSLDSTALGPLTDPDPNFPPPGFDSNANPVGYLEDLDFWIIRDPYAGVIGFVPASAVEEEAPEPGEDDQTITIGEDGALGYAEADANSEVIREFDPGTELIVVEAGEDWIEVLIDEDGNTAFIPVGAVEDEDDEDDDDEDDETPPGDDDEDDDEDDETPPGDDDEDDDETPPGDDDEDDDEGDDDEDAVEYTALIVEPDEVPPGGSFVVSASGFEPGEDVVLEYNPIATVTADASGGIEEELYISEDAPVGTVYEITATGQDSGLIAVGEVTVVAPTGPAGEGPGAEDDGGAADDGSDDELAQTGLSGTEAGLLGGLLLALGGALTAFGYRGKWARRNGAA